MEKKKKFLHILLTKDLLTTLKEKNVDKKNPYGIFLLLELDINNTPIGIIEKCVEPYTYIPVKNNIPIPYYFLMPFELEKNKYFKCDNCDITGQQRGYVIYFGQGVIRNLCSICTEGI